MHRRIRIERFNPCKQFLLCCLRREVNLQRTDPKFFTLLLLFAHIHLRSWVVSHEDDRKAGRDAPRKQRIGSGLYVCKHILGHFFSFNDGRHSVSNRLLQVKF